MRDRGWSSSAPCLKIRRKDSKSIGRSTRSPADGGKDHATYEDASRTETRWSSSATGTGGDSFRRAQPPPEFCCGPEEYCFHGPSTVCGSRTAGTCVALFAGATGKGRHPQSFGDGE